MLCIDGRTNHSFKVPKDSLYPKLDAKCRYCGKTLRESAMEVLAGDDSDFQQRIDSDPAEVLNVLLDWQRAETNPAFRRSFSISSRADLSIRFHICVCNTTTEPEPTHYHHELVALPDTLPVLTQAVRNILKMFMSQVEEAERKREYLNLHPNVHPGSPSRKKPDAN